jgi:hypothetical protein
LLPRLGRGGRRSRLGRRRGGRRPRRLGCCSRFNRRRGTGRHGLNQGRGSRRPDGPGGPGKSNLTRRGPWGRRLRPAGGLGNNRLSGGGSGWRGRGRRGLDRRRSARLQDGRLYRSRRRGPGGRRRGSLGSRAWLRRRGGGLVGRGLGSFRLRGRWLGGHGLGSDWLRCGGSGRLGLDGLLGGFLGCFTHARLLV